MNMNNITYLHSEPIVDDKSKNGISKIVDTHLANLKNKMEIKE
jgi:hypothetical protein